MFELWWTALLLEDTAKALDAVRSSSSQRLALPPSAPLNDKIGGPCCAEAEAREAEGAAAADASLELLCRFSPALSPLDVTRPPVLLRNAVRADS